MHEIMSLELARRRREEMMREVERNRLVEAWRAARKLRADRRSAPLWQMKRQAGRLLKLLRPLRNA
jgi:hypothetical protein